MKGRGSGEEVSLAAIAQLLKKKGHTIIPYVRSSLEIQNMKLGKARAFLAGIYNMTEGKRIRGLLDKERPDLAFVQNIFPLISPAALLACRRANIPIVMRCPNYRLLCPNGLFLTHGEICERCAAGKEYWCILRNCEDDFCKSIGYALRGFIARRFGLIRDNVDVFMVLTEFAKKKLVQNGFPSRKVMVISGLVSESQVGSSDSNGDGHYVAYVGRLSREKGPDLVVRAAKKLPHVLFKIAGDYEERSRLIERLSHNVEFLGNLDSKSLMQLYAGARMLVVPSCWYEGLPMVMIEAMLHGKPIVCSDIGGLREVVEDGVTGFLFRRDDLQDFTLKIQALWNDPSLCRRMGAEGRIKAEGQYSPDAFYQRLMRSYEMASHVRS